MGSQKFEPSDKPDGRYVDLEALTSGGMGVVYKAYDTILDKPIAIKTLLFDHKTEKLVARFQLEAKLISKLNHPNIVSILDFGLSKEQEPYMVMDFVIGESLEQLISKKTKLSASEIVEIARQICRGMTHAHSKSIIHRDIKPGNILIAEDSPPGENIRIVDFGIAKISDSSDEEGFRTSGQHVLGSPYYMSPEQVENGIIDERTDVYSLGCVMYKMASGHPPFRGETALDTMQAHLNEKPKSLDIEDENDILASNLNDLILKCLDKEPDLRFQSMAEILEVFDSREFRQGNKPAYDIPLQETEKKSSLIPIIAVGILGLGLIGFLFFSTFRLGEDNIDVYTSERAYKRASQTEAVKKFDKSGKIQKWIPKNYKSITDNDLLVFKTSYQGIRNMVLADTAVTSKGISYLTSLNLVRIDLTGTKIDDQAAESIKKFRMLYDLTVEDTKIGDQFLEDLDNKNIHILNISCCPRVSDKGMKLIVDKWPNLENINIESTKLSETGMLKVCELKNLKRLTLSELKITDKFADRLAQSKTLKSLIVARAKISPANLDKLVAIKSLEKIDAINTRPDYDTWIKQVIEKHPNLENADTIERNRENLPSEEELPGFMEEYFTR